LIEAGVARVFFGARDLNPNVRGNGARLLRDAGLEVVEGVLHEEAQRLTQHFNSAMRMGRPFISLKAGMTLDGRTGTASGESKWITSKAQRAAARNLRRLFDGVLVGCETAIQDDPILLPGPRTLRPYTRVVLDSHLRLPRSSRLVKSARRNPLILIGGESGEPRRRGLEALGVDVILVDTPGGRVSLRKALGGLFDRGLTSLMVEGGSEVMGSFVREQLFDELVVFRAPLLLGGRGSRPVVGGRNPRGLAEAVRMRRAVVESSATLRYGLEDRSGLEVEVYERKG
jgi:diaminohydroxyphosphoribosylaminopyrimidine deaminase/5-amino-6-(5-phosphoribosylamino)uracil reductase